MNDYLRLGLLVLGIYLIYRFKWPKILIVAVLLVDLLPLSFRIIKPVSPAPIFQSKKLMSDKGLYRVWAFDQNIATQLMYWGVQVVNGYHPAKTKIIQDYFENAGGGKSPNMLNIKYIIHEGRIYDNMDFLPRAWFARSTQVLSLDSIYQYIQDTLWNPLEVAYVEEPVRWEGWGRVDSLWFSPDEITMKTTGGGFLVLSEIFFPHWKAYVNGVPTKIYKVNGLIRGIVVPSGGREVVFRYEPDFTLGKVITLAGWTLILILLVWSFWGKK